MADLVDKAESELAQMVSRATTTMVKATGQQALRVSVKVSGGVLAAPYKAAAAMWNVVSRMINPQEGKVSLKAFAQLSDGKRAAVKLDDDAVSREFERELKRHGVTWAVERHPDGAQMFHIQGKDAELIQHALGVAAARVDEKIARDAPKLRQDDEQQQVVPERAYAVQPHGTDELREDAPARSSAADTTPEHDDAAPERDDAAPERDDAAPQRDEAMTDRGGHTELRDAPAERPTRVLSPRDQTREKVVKRIDHEVKEKKNEQRQTKTRTKTRASGREATTEGREAARRSRS